MTTVSELRGSRDLLVNLTMRDVRGKYKRTLLGQTWSLINPLATLLIYTVVFGVLLKVQAPRGEPSGIHVYALDLLTALLPWSFMQNSATGGMGSLISNGGLIKKVYFPREVLVTATVLAWDVSFSFELLACSLVLVAFGAFIWPWIPLVVVFIALLTCFSLGLGLALSVANVYFRDTQQFVNIFMQIWFYLTPIVYPVTYVAREAPHLARKLALFGHPLPVMGLYELNPMERYCASFQALLYDNRLPSAADFLGAVAWAVISLTVGYLIFRRHQARLAEEL